jgi:DNA-directed RNA polymerase specialized sigma24 family protein
MSETLANNGNVTETLGVRLWLVAKGWILAPEKASDESLMEAAIEGDKWAFEVLVDRYELDLFRYCMGLLGDPDQAREAAREVLTSACVMASTFDHSRSLKSWFFRMARNLCLNRILQEHPNEEWASHAFAWHHPGVAG